MKYKLINNKTKEEHLCEKVTIDGFEYYVSVKEQPKIDGELYHCKHKGKGINIGSGQPPQKLILSIYSTNRNLCSDCKKVIATNNPNIDILQVVDDYKNAKWWAADLHGYDKNCELPTNDVEINSFIKGYNKAQEMFLFTEEDMIDFGDWLSKNNYEPIHDGRWCEKYMSNTYSTKELLQLWKEQQPKTVYYE